MKILMLLNKKYRTDERVKAEREKLIEDGHIVDVFSRHKEQIDDNCSIDDGGIISFIKDSKLMRLIGDFSQMLSLPFFNFKLLKNGLKYRHFDVIHAHDFDTLISGIILRFFTGKKLVFDAHEIYNKMVAEDMPNCVCRFLKSIENFFIKAVDYLIVASPGYWDYYIHKIGRNTGMMKVSHYKPLLWNNYYPPKNDKFTLLYIGSNLSEKRYIPQMIDLTRDLDIILRIGGVMNEKHKKIIKYVKNNNYKHVELIGELPDVESILRETRRADATFIISDPKKYPLYKFNIFNKQFESMSAGRPIIVINGMNASIITREEKCGFSIPYDDMFIRLTIAYMKNNPEICKIMGKNALKAAKNKYNWETESKNLKILYNIIEEDINGNNRYFS